MANELYSTISLKAAKGGADISKSVAGRRDMTGEDLVQSTQLIGTTAETVGFGEITGAPQAVLITNLDATNFVEFGGDTGLTVFKLSLLAGESMFCRLTSGTLYAKADTADVRIQVLAVEA